MTILELFSLLGGLGLFLYGMKLMSDGMEAAAGDKLRNILESLTRNRFSAIGVGAGVTALVQSSNAVAVMCVGFVNAGLMTLQQSIFVGMGANIGTTITAQLIAFKFSTVAPLILFLGVLLMFFFKKRNLQRIGQIIGGLGILFVGMTLMTSALEPLKDYEPFVNALSSFSTPAIGILVGFLFTCAIQSSSAAMGVLQAFAMQGILGLDQSVYVIMGVNIGACITALIASLTANKTGKRTAVALLLHNALGVAIFSALMLVLPIADWVKAWSPDDPVRQLANFHTFFNVLTTAILMWMPVLLIKISTLIVPGKDRAVEAKHLQYITKGSVTNPTVAVGQAILEVVRVANMALENYSRSVTAFVKRKEKLANEVMEDEGTVDYLNHEITDYLAELSQGQLSSVDSRVVMELMQVMVDIERISDHGENISRNALRCIDKHIRLSDAALKELETMGLRSQDALTMAIKGLSVGDKDAARAVLAIEEEVDAMDHDYNKAHVRRLTKKECTADASTVFTDVVHNMERVADHSTNLAYAVLQGDMYKN